MEMIQVLMVYLGVFSALNCMAGCLDLVYDGMMVALLLGGGALLFYAFFSVLETVRGYPTRQS